MPIPHPEQTSARQLVTLSQAVSARPWLTVRLLRHLVSQRRVPFYKPAGRILFDLGELDEWAENARVAPIGPRTAIRRA